MGCCLLDGIGQYCSGWVVACLILESNILEAFSVNDCGTGFVVFLFGDPHLLERRQGGQDGSSDPHRVFSLWWGDDLDLHGGWGQLGDLLLHAVGDAGEHGGSSRQDGVGVQILTDVDVALHDRVVGGLVDAGGFHSDEGGLEQSLGASESLVSNGDHLSIGQLVALLQRGATGGSLHLLLKVQSDVRQLLFDVTHDLTLCGGGEGVATLRQDLHHVICEITSSQIETKDGVGEGVPLVDGYCVGDTITGVEHDTGGTSGRIQGEHGLDGNVHG